MKRIRIGAVSWDCSLPADTYFGYYQTRTLSPKKYRSFTPYYAEIIDENEIAYHTRTREEFDRELVYAIRAGINYLAYVFYPDEGSRAHVQASPTDCSHRVHELNYARRMHERSKWRLMLNIAAIVATHPFMDADVEELVTLMSKPYYERLDGRPLLYVYNGVREDIIGRIRTVCSARGVNEPFFVAMAGEVLSPDDNYEVVDALSAYACLGANISSYSKLCDEMIKNNRERLGKCRYVVPHFTVGWNPSPRIDIPSPWVKYANTEYAPIATAEELTHGAELLSEWIRREAWDCFLGHILTFAWNEFEEGAWLCPTYNPDLTVNEERIDTFASIVELWKNKLADR